MKKIVWFLVAVCMAFAGAACGGSMAESEGKEWTRQGYFTDGNEHMLTVMWMDEADEPGWYVGVLLGEIMGGGTLPLDGGVLHGSLYGWDENAEPLNVTVSEEGEDGLLLAMDSGESFHFTPMDIQEASIAVTINTEGWGYIAYAEGEETPAFDPEFPSQSAYIGLAEPATYTFAAQPMAGNLFVRWTKNGEAFSTDPKITLPLDESADFCAVFEEDPDWQNPVVNYMGRYQCDRASATIECMGFDEASISIEWANSARAVTNWVIFGSFDAESLSIAYDGCSKMELVYDENGEVISDDSEYEEVPGVITFNEEGSFTWHRDLSEGQEDMVFEWINNE